MKTVTIISPVYNVEKYLPACIESLLAQTYPALEILLVDDGATDRSGDICDQYAARDTRVRVIHQANGGAANAKNTGLDAATGDYVTFIDSDDVVTPDWIAAQVAALEAHDADVAECHFEKFYPGRVENVPVGAFPAGVYTAEEYLQRYLHDWTCSLFWNKLFRRELVAQVRFRRERRCIDDEFFTYKALSGARRIVKTEQVLYRYRQRRSSAVSSLKNRRQIADDALEILMERYQWICRRFPALRDTYLQHDVDILFYIAGLDHTGETVRKFRRVARYYLGQCLRRFPGRVTLVNALQAQWISQKRLLTPQTVEAKDLSDYFD